MKFKQFSLECPWHNDGECSASGDWIDNRESCNEDNCAPLYWIGVLVDYVIEKDAVS